MNMIEAVKSVLSQYVGFKGRARRSEYWYWFLATILVAIAISILEYALGIGSDGSGPLSSIFSLLIFLPGLAVSFRRLHDTGRSGWWILLRINRISYRHRSSRSRYSNDNVCGVQYAGFRHWHDRDVSSYSCLCYHIARFPLPRQSAWAEQIWTQPKRCR